MKTKLVFSRYRRAVYIVLAVIVCLSAGYILKRYKERPPNRVGIYDLKWSDKTDKGDIVYRRWRYFLKPRSYLPLRVEKYSKRDPNDNYTLEETLVIGYPTTEQIRQAIKDAGF